MQQAQHSGKMVDGQEGLKKMPPTPRRSNKARKGAGARQSQSKRKSQPKANALRGSVEKSSDSPTSPDSPSLASPLPVGGRKLPDHYGDALGRNQVLSNLDVNSILNNIGTVNASGTNASGFPMSAVQQIQGMMMNRTHIGVNPAALMAQNVPGILPGGMPGGTVPGMGGMPGMPGGGSPSDGSPDGGQNKSQSKKKAKKKAKASPKSHSPAQFNEFDVQRLWHTGIAPEHYAQHMQAAVQLGGKVDSVHVQLLQTQALLAERNKMITELSVNNETLTKRLEETETRVRMAVSYFDKEILYRLKENRDQKREYSELEKRQVEILEEQKLEVEQHCKEEMTSLRTQVAQLTADRERLLRHEEENKQLKEHGEDYRAKLNKAKLDIEEQDKEWHVRFTATLRMLQQKYQQKFDQAVATLPGKNKTVMEGIVAEHRGRINTLTKKLLQQKRDFEGLKKEKTMLADTIKQGRTDKELLQSQLRAVIKMLAVTNKHNKSLYISCEAMKGKLVSYLKLKLEEEQANQERLAKAADDREEDPHSRDKRLLREQIRAKEKENAELRKWALELIKQRSDVEGYLIEALQECGGYARGELPVHMRKAHYRLPRRLQRMNPNPPPPPMEAITQDCHAVPLHTLTQGQDSMDSKDGDGHDRPPPRGRKTHHGQANDNDDDDVTPAIGNFSHMQTNKPSINVQSGVEGTATYDPYGLANFNANGTSTRGGGSSKRGMQSVMRGGLPGAPPDFGGGSLGSDGEGAGGGLGSSRGVPPAVGGLVASNPNSNPLITMHAEYTMNCPSSRPSSSPGRRPVAAFRHRPGTGNAVHNKLVPKNRFDEKSMFPTNIQFSPEDFEVAGNNNAVLRDPDLLRRLPGREETNLMIQGKLDHIMTGERPDLAVWDGTHTSNSGDGSYIHGSIRGSKLGKPTDPLDGNNDQYMEYLRDEIDRVDTVLAKVTGERPEEDDEDFEDDETDSRQNSKQRGGRDDPSSSSNFRVQARDSKDRGMSSNADDRGCDADLADNRRYDGSLPMSDNEDDPNQGGRESSGKFRKSGATNSESLGKNVLSKSGKAEHELDKDSNASSGNRDRREQIGIEGKIIQRQNPKDTYLSAESDLSTAVTSLLHDHYMTALFGECEMKKADEKREDVLNAGEANPEDNSATQLLRDMTLFRKFINPEEAERIYKEQIVRRLSPENQKETRTLAKINSANDDANDGNNDGQAGYTGNDATGQGGALGLSNGTMEILDAGQGALSGPSAPGTQIVSYIPPSNAPSFGPQFPRTMTDTAVVAATTSSTNNEGNAIEKISANNEAANQGYYSSTGEHTSYRSYGVKAIPDSQKTQELEELPEAPPSPTYALPTPKPLVLTKAMGAAGHRQDPATRWWERRFNDGTIAAQGQGGFKSETHHSASTGGSVVEDRNANEFFKDIPPGTIQSVHPRPSLKIAGAQFVPPITGAKATSNTGKGTRAKFGQTANDTNNTSNWMFDESDSELNKMNSTQQGQLNSTARSDQVHSQAQESNGFDEGGTFMTGVDIENHAENNQSSTPNQNNQAAASNQNTASGAAATSSSWKFSTSSSSHARVDMFLPKASSKGGDGQSTSKRGQKGYQKGGYQKGGRQITAARSGSGDGGVPTFRRGDGVTKPPGFQHASLHASAQGSGACGSAASNNPPYGDSLQGISHSDRVGPDRDAQLPDGACLLQQADWQDREDVLKMLFNKIHENSANTTAVINQLKLKLQQTSKRNAKPPTFTTKVHAAFHAAFGAKRKAPGEMLQEILGSDPPSRRSSYVGNITPPFDD